MKFSIIIVLLLTTCVIYENEVPDSECPVMEYRNVEGVEYSRCYQ